MSKLTSGAKILVGQCMNIKVSDRVIVIGENDRQEISFAIEAELKEKGIPYSILFIEDFIKRPASELPEKMIEEIKAFKPTVSIYAATGKSGELPVFRRPLMNLLTKDLNCRHGHMIGIDKEVFEIGMNQDYDHIYDFTNKITNLARKAEKIKATCPYGTEIEFEIENSKYLWEPCTGKIQTQGTFSNLPDGETFTYPANANGKIVAWVLGDSFITEGVLQEPLIVEVKDSYITKIECKNNRLENEFKEYVATYKDGNRVGELGIGTLLNLKEFCGNLLLDEKFPGIHVAFGYPYPDVTKAQWTAESHVDIIPKEVDMEFFMNKSWVKVMRKGEYLYDVIESLISQNI